MEDLNNMQLHDIKPLNKNLTVVKVPHGWIYIFQAANNGGITSQFVTSRREKHV